jgi:acyl-CoA ligase (AMP-forming) (exosortase A-associated)
MDFLIHHMLWSSAQRLPDKEALVHGQDRLTYAELVDHVARLAVALRRAGLRRGDRVGIYLEPSLAQVVAIFAVSQADGVFVPINAALVPEQVKHIASDCTISGLITTAARLTALADVLGELPSLKFAFTADPAPAITGPVSVAALPELPPVTLPPRPANQNIGQDLAAILYTSGSTGKPKGVMLSHAQIMAGSSIVSSYLEITEADRILAVLPFSFDAGLNQLMTAVQQGGTLVLIKFVFAREVVDVLLRERITGLAGVPTFWSLLTQPSSGLLRHRFPHLRYITNTGGTMPQSVLATLRQALPTTKIYLMYGLTEAFRSTYLPPEELDRRPTSIGKAIPNTEILVINDQGQLCKPGEVGELVHRGPTVSMGYWGKPELTAAVLRPHPLLPAELGDSERVAYSGDLVTLDEDGFLYFVGRRDNMIKSAGFRISPTEIEEVLMQSRWLREAAVIGVPDPVLGQAIKAVVVPAEGVTVTGEDLRTFCAARLPAYMVPRTVELVQDLPKTTSGKIDYPALRRREGC